MSGPAPIPSYLKLVRGNPGKRPVNRDEPRPATYKVAPAPPTFLCQYARAEWRRIVRDLVRMGVLTKLDRPMLAAYCQCYGRWREAEEEITRVGKTITLRDKDGRVKYVQQLPHVSIARNALAELRQLAREFGFTPSARTRIKAPSDQTDLFDDDVFLDGPAGA